MLNHVHTSRRPLESEELIATLTGGVELDAELVSGAIAAGITEATVADMSLTLHPGEGATGDDLVGGHLHRRHARVHGQHLAGGQPHQPEPDL